MNIIFSEVLCNIHRLELCRNGTATSKNWTVDDNSQRNS